MNTIVGYLALSHVSLSCVIGVLFIRHASRKAPPTPERQLRFLAAWLVVICLPVGGLMIALLLEHYKPAETRQPWLDVDALNGSRDLTRKTGDHGLDRSRIRHGSSVSNSEPRPPSRVGTWTDTWPDGWHAVWPGSEFHSSELSGCDEPGECEAEDLAGLTDALPIHEDVAPLQDILMLAGFERRREVILDILKTDVLAYTRYVRMALGNEDSETAHFAAAGLQHAQQKLDSRHHELAARFAAAPDDSRTAAAYASLLDEYLALFRLDPATRLHFLQESIRVSRKLVDAAGTRPDVEFIVPIGRLIEHLLEAGETQEARVYCRRLLNDCPDTEEKYLVLLKCYFNLKDKPHFEETLARFRVSGIRLSPEALNIVRLWSGASR